MVMGLHRLVILTVVATVCLPGATNHGRLSAAEPLADEQLLRAVGRSSDGPALLDFFHQRTRTTIEPAEARALVAELGDRSGAVREKAVGELVALGSVVVPYLREAARDPDDPDRTRRARRCL